MSKPTYYVTVTRRTEQQTARGEQISKETFSMYHSAYMRFYDLCNENKVFPWDETPMYKMQAYSETVIIDLYFVTAYETKAYAQANIN